jgi:hypothetical protein
MAVAGVLTKIVSKPAVLTSILGAAGGFGLGGALLGGESSQSTTQTTTGGDVYNTTYTPSTIYQNDYSTKVVSTSIIDSPFASVDTGITGNTRASQEPDVSTEASSEASSDAATGGGPDMLIIAGIGAAVLGGLYLVSRGDK